MPRHATFIAVPALLLALCLMPPPSAQAAQPKAQKSSAQTTSTEAAKPAGETVQLSGRVVAGLDQVFIKDATQGYFLVQGANLAPHSGRFITATGVVTGQSAEYRTIRLTGYRISSPDDESPGAEGSVKQAAPAGAKRKK
jgi:hypothetical protein